MFLTAPITSPVSVHEIRENDQYVLQQTVSQNTKTENHLAKDVVTLLDTNTKIRFDEKNTFHKNKLFSSPFEISLKYEDNIFIVGLKDKKTKELIFQMPSSAFIHYITTRAAHNH